VSVQPSPPPTEIGVCTPEAARVLASAISPCQVVGVLVMPAFLNAVALYQTVDLSDASTGTPYSVPLTVARFAHSVAKF